jgi:UDP-2,3-diacylglucosamine pyrophosphatase LpxH
MRHVRTIWISDTHLGFRESKAELLLDFLQHHEANQLYLVGDIVDGWALRRSWYWPAEHQAVLHTLIRKARRGTRTTYIPGNHDAPCG